MRPRPITPFALAAAVLAAGVATAQPPIPLPMPPSPVAVPTAPDALPAVAAPAEVAPPAGSAPAATPATTAVECPEAPCRPACPPACAPACPPVGRPGPRVIVVKVPTPDVILRPAAACRTGTCTAPGPVCRPAPTGAAPAATGMTTVYHTYTVPYVTYNWVPVAQQPVGVGFAGAAPVGLTGVTGLAGLAGAAPVGLTGLTGVAPVGAVAAPVGLGTGVTGAAPAVTGGVLTAELESLLVKALLNRFVAPAVAPVVAPPAADACDAKVRALQAQIAELDKRIECLRKDTHEATLLNARAVVDLQKEVDQLLDAVSRLDPKEEKTTRVVGDLQEAVKKIQAERKK